MPSLNRILPKFTRPAQGRARLERVLEIERGCVEDQPQRVKRFLAPQIPTRTAAGRGRHSRAPAFQNTRLVRWRWLASVHERIPAGHLAAMNLG